MKSWPTSLVQLGLVAPSAPAGGGTGGARSFVLHPPAVGVITASVGIGCAQPPDAAAIRPIREQAMKQEVEVLEAPVGGECPYVACIPQQGELAADLLGRDEQSAPLA